jgi:hypothetical protein
VRDQPSKARQAAATAASTSAALAWVIWAIGWPLAGLTLSNSRSSAGSVQAPSINMPKRRPCASSHSWAGLALSGAGP